MVQTLHTKLKFLLLWSVLLISFGFISGYLLLSVSGYRIDWKWLRIEKTGIVTIKSQPKVVSVIVDASLRATSTPVALRNLLPGVYDISINKPLYQGWNKTIQVDPGRVTELNDIVLVRVNPVVEKVSQNDKQLLDDFVQTATVRFVGNEIYIHSKTPQLVTRLSRDVSQAVLYPDEKHIVYQIGNEINIIDLIGQNEQSITRLPTDKQSQIIIVDNGRSILIKQESTYLRLTIG